jgi:hypothetical protein
MAELNQNWITEGLMDFEYKKYILLAYLKNCRDHFQDTRLYPPLGSLVHHYNNLHELSKSIEQLQHAFPKELKGFDFTKLKLDYEQQKLDNEHMSAVHEIIDYALPAMREVLDEGKEIYEIVEKHIEITPLGIMPVYTQEGYLLVHEESQPEVHVFQYQHGIIVSSSENLRSLTLRYLSKEVKSLANTFEQIKLKITERFRELPQPAAYLCVSKLPFPLLETIIPVTKRIMLSRVMM